MATRSNRPTTTRRAEQGFTLIELLVVAFVVLLVTSMGLPSLADWRARQKVAGAAEALAADLQKARWAAVQRGATMYVTFGHGAAACYAIATRPDCPCDGSGAACSLKTVSAGSGLLLQAPRASLAFEPRHGATSPGEVATFSAGRYAASLHAEAVGRATVCASGAPMLGVDAC